MFNPSPLPYCSPNNIIIIAENECAQNTTTSEKNGR